MPLKPAAKLTVTCGAPSHHSPLSVLKLVRKRHILSCPSQVASYERLLRQLLTGTVNAYSKPKPVATLIVNMWRCCRYDGKHYHIMRFHE